VRTGLFKALPKVLQQPNSKQASIVQAEIGIRVGGADPKARRLTQCDRL